MEMDDKIPYKRIQPKGVYSYEDIWILKRSINNRITNDLSYELFHGDGRSVRVWYKYDNIPGNGSYETPIFWRYLMQEEYREIARNKGIPTILWVPAQTLCFNHWEKISD